MRQIKRFKNDILIDGVLVYREAIDEQDVELEDWEEIEPKYYIDKSDAMIFEIWYDRTGIILDRGLDTHLKNDAISTVWGIERFEEINKESAMIKYNERLLREQVLAELDAKDVRIGYYDKAMMKIELGNYNNRKLMKRDESKYKAGDILKVIGGHDREIGTLFKVEDCTTRYKAEDVELYTGLLTTNEEINIYNQPILDIKFEEAKNAFLNGQWIKSKSDSIDAMKYNIQNNKLYIGVDFSNDEPKKPKGCNAEPIKQQNNGGSSDWYSLPENAKTLQDLIEHRNMNGAVKDIFKACYRLGIKTEDELRDLNKTAYYALREIGRVSGRKDYITIAKELIGTQAIEKE